MNRPPGPIPVDMAVARISAALQILADRFNVRMDEASADLVTQNILIEISTNLQKFSWFWQA